MRKDLEAEATRAREEARRTRDTRRACEEADAVRRREARMVEAARVR